MSDRTDQPLSDYLNELRARADMSLEDVARQAGYKGRSSVQRYFEDASIEVLSPKVATKLAKAFYQKGDPQISVIDLARLVVKSPEDLQMSGAQIRAFLGLFHGENTGPTAVEYRISGMVPVMGVAYASNWMEQAPSLDEPEDWLAIPFHNSTPDYNLYALKVAGPSVNKVAPEGHFAICQRFGEDADRVPSGCYVHVQRTKNDLVEWTIKKVRWKGNSIVLWPDSDHEAHQEPIEMGGRDYKVRILGLVVGWYRPA